MDNNASANSDPMGLPGLYSCIFLCQNYGHSSRSRDHFADPVGISDVTIRNGRLGTRSKLLGLSAQTTTRKKRFLV